jgi:hypothetical protein
MGEQQVYCVTDRSLAGSEGEPRRAQAGGSEIQREREHKENEMKNEREKDTNKKKTAQNHGKW